MTEVVRVKLFGRVFIGGRIRLLSGLHIGVGREELQIGGIDNAVLRDAVTFMPYVPGSSLKGKMRSLWEKINGAEQNYPIRRQEPVVRIHVCREPTCRVCRIFGVPGNERSFFPTRLIVRDVQLDPAETEAIALAERTDNTYTEIKYEAAIDRVTSAAVPRPMERVPAGAVFGPFEMVYSVYESGDVPRFGDLLEAMQLLEDDYLGGLGSRGSGKIRFENLSISVRNAEDYGTLQKWPIEGDKDQGLTVQNVLDKLGSVPGPGVAPDEDTLLGWLSAQVPIAEDATAS